MRENTATLYCAGRDIPYRELTLEFDGKDHIWKLLSDDCEQAEQPNERILFFSLNCCAGSRRSAPLPRCCWKRSTLPVRRD